MSPKINSRYVTRCSMLMLLGLLISGHLFLFSDFAAAQGPYLANTASATSTDVSGLDSGHNAVSQALCSGSCPTVKVIDTTPTTNTVTAPTNTDISVTFDGAIDTSSVTSQTFAVHSLQSGLITGTYTFGGGDTTATLNPHKDFFVGETIFSSLTTGITDGSTPITPHGWQFTTMDVTNRCVSGFTNINVGLTGVTDGGVAWGDYDNDGDLDILLSGVDSGDTPISQVWRNNGDNTFTNINAGLTGVEDSSVAWGDYDNDGDLDILLSG
ncbi:MAG: FG-GAP-like repeat-containing protein, partial [Chloroflexota bacterium]